MTAALNKTSVSNEITGLRPMVKQAIVHIAHHLTREIKKCENRKGEKNRTKFENRAKNLREEVLALKDINPDTVSRYALLMDFSQREKFLNDVNVPLQTKVMVRVATHKSVMKNIQNFRGRYPDWNTKLSGLIENLGIRTKFKKKVKKQIEKNQAKLKKKMQKGDSSAPLDKKSQGKCETKQIKAGLNDQSKDNGFTDPSDESHIESADDEISSIEQAPSEAPARETEVLNRGAVTGEHILRKNKQLEEITSLKQDNREKNRSEERHDTGKFINIALGEESGEESETSISEADVPVNHKIYSSRNASAEVRPFSELLKSISAEESKMNSEELISDNDSDLGEGAFEDEEKVEDPFFVTEDNDFLKTAAVKRDNGEGLGQHSQRRNDGIRFTEDAGKPQKWEKDGGKNVLGNRAQRRAKLLGKEPPKPKFGRGGSAKNSNFSSSFSGSSKTSSKWQKFEHGQGDESIKSRRSFSSPKFNRKTLEHSVDESTTQHTFKGKIGNKSEFPCDKRKDKFPRGGSEGCASTNSDGEKLHPSWEAKRKQKVTLGSFQGKKIKFEED